MADPTGPGIVDGTENDDVIEVGFADGEGDAVANAGAAISAQGGDDLVIGGNGDDTIYAGNGDDTVYAGAGDDLVHGDETDPQDADLDEDAEPGDDLLAGEGGSDTVMGGGGDDVIYGGYAPTSPPATAGGVESFNWSEIGAPADGDVLSAPTVQDTGTVSVSFSTTLTDSASAEFDDAAQITDGIDTGDETANANSGLRLDTGAGAGATTTAALEFSEAVENAQFRINDIDGNAVTKVWAYDTEGNRIEVTLTAEDGSNLHLVDIDGDGTTEGAISNGSAPSDAGDPANSVLVDISGPVARIEIITINLDDDPADVTVSDVFFTTDGIAVSEEDGDDVLVGGDGSDLIFGQDGADLITGGEGMDTLDGGADSDTIVGGSHLDFVLGGETGEDNDTLDLRGLGAVSIVYTDADREEGVVVVRETGEAVAFSEIENILFDEEVAPDGIVEGTLGDEVIDINYNGDPNGDFVDNDDAILPGQFGNDDIIVAGEGNDTVIAAMDDDLVFAGDGNDIVDSSFGSDTLFGQEGNDYIDGREDDDYLRGGDGNDTIFGGDGNDLARGDDGDDLIATGSGNDTASGNDGDDYIDAFTGNDEVSGDAGNDTLLGNDGDDTVSGGEGDDILVGGAGDDSLFAGDGDDTIFSGGGSDYAEGGSGDDRLVSAGGDTMLGGDDRDTFYGAVGDEIIGGEGGVDEDTLIINGPAEIEYAGGDPASEAGIVYYLDGGGIRTGETLVFEEIETVFIRELSGDGVVEGTESANTIDSSYIEDPEGDLVDNFDGFDNITRTDLFSQTPNSFVELPSGPITNSQDDAVLAGGGNDTVIGGVGDDVIYGGEGDDVLEGGLGRDDLVGGAGNDFIVNTAGVSRMFGGDGNDTFVGGIQSDLMYGSSGNDSFLGNQGNDIIDGGDGDDTIDGGLGGDTITGGDGNDSIVGGLGDDLISTGAGNNFVDAGLGDNQVIAGEGNDSLTGDAGDDLFEAGAGDDTVDSGAGNDNVLGEAGDDLIIGGAGEDTLDGGEGNDAITGGTPGIVGLASVGQTPDTIIGGAGNDTLNGDSGDDLIDGGDDDDLIGGGIGGDTIIGGDGNDVIFGEETIDLITGDLAERPDDFDDALALEPGDDSIDGGAGSDTIYGEEGNDTIIGGEGADEITGGLGTDVLFGGDDEDEFFVDRASEGIGDEIFGGDGGDVDQDELSLFGEQGIDWRLTDLETDSDGNGLDGTVEFLDSSGDAPFVIGTMTFENIEIVCFTPGTKILTPMGEVSVEDLQEGDLVVTRDNGLQPIRWSGSRRLNAAELAARPQLRPILIRQGALGPNQPERDMMVSPNHRMLLVSEQAELLFEEREVLVAAKHLTHLDGVEKVKVEDVTYIHIMCDQHEVVLADGAWSESFQPGDYSMNGIEKAQREEIYALFPELREQEGLDAYSAARISLKRHEAQLLA